MNIRNRKDVLIGDDDDGIRGLLAVALKHDGFACDDASDGDVAVRHLERNDYAVVLLDLMMPALDGAGVLQNMQENPTDPERRPVVLVMTAIPDPASQSLPGDSVQAIIRKPFDVTELTALVGGCVAAHRAHQP
jgi:DNA-binding response OmpR family regulator